MKNNTNKHPNVSSVDAEILSSISITNNDTPLKPCPFCGVSEVRLIEVKYFLDGDDGYYVACTHCNANQFPDSKERAIHGWNQREKPNTEQAGAV